ncbi:MAG: BCD family MFS transporter [Bosea sp.]|jgi:BCD family chlorophyll transporter-like MFS transporter|nr:BCD family MFS transporter [Bosea sp. (in: a-proteobacteria)]
MRSASSRPDLSWIGIVRLGLVQTALGAIIVLTTSTLNRVMVVELALPAILPGLLVGLHYALQVLRPRWGFGADKGQRATPWIVGGMGMLAGGGFVASLATALMSVNLAAGIALALVGFVLIGIGVGASGTSLLVLLAKRVAPERRAPAATLVWLMMIFGFAATAGLAGHFLDPFSTSRMITVAAILCSLAFLVSVLAVAGVEGPAAAQTQSEAEQEMPFRAAIAEVWAEPRARLFALFIIISMLAYSGQDLILEPFAGIVFGFTPGGSTKLSGVQHGGVLVGMIFVALAAGPLAKGRLGSLGFWTIAGCVLSAIVLLALVIASNVGPAWPLRANVFALGVANGIYAAAAIGSMMLLAGSGRRGREGTRMGLWGAGQALAMGAGGLIGAGAVDVARWLSGSPFMAYAAVFTGEAVLFLIAALIAARVAALGAAAPQPAATTVAGPRHSIAIQANREPSR